MVTDTRIAVFKGQQIRKTIYQNEWCFSVVDVVATLADSPDAGAYWRKLKQRLSEEGSEVVTFCHGLKLTAPDGKMRETDCANTEIHRTENSIGLPKLKNDAHADGNIAGNARKALGKRLKRPIVSKHNYLKEREAQKKLRDRV